MEELNEELDLTVYNKIDEILCENSYYGYATEQEIREHLKNKENGEEDDVDFKVKSSKAFLFWYLTKKHPDEDPEILKDAIIDVSHDMGIDAAYVETLPDGSNRQIAYIYQAKYWETRLPAEQISPFEDILHNFENLLKFYEDHSTVYYELEERGVFSDWGRPAPQIKFVLVTTSELNSSAQEEWDRIDELARSSRYVKVGLIKEDMHALEQYL